MSHNSLQDKQSQTAKALSLSGVSSIMNFLHLSLFLSWLSWVTVTSWSHHIYAPLCRELWNGAWDWSNWEWPAYYRRNESCFDPCQPHLPEPCLPNPWLYVSFLHVPFCSPCLSYLLALGGLLSPISNFMMWDMLLLWSRWFSFDISVWPPPREWLGSKLWLGGPWVARNSAAT